MFCGKRARKRRLLCRDRLVFKPDQILERAIMRIAVDVRNSRDHSSRLYIISKLTAPSIEHSDVQTEEDGVRQHHVRHMSVYAFSTIRFLADM